MICHVIRVYGVAQSPTWLKRLSSSSCSEGMAQGASQREWILSKEAPERLNHWITLLYTLNKEIIVNQQYLNLKKRYSLIKNCSKFVKFFLQLLVFSMCLIGLVVFCKVGIQLTFPHGYQIVPMGRFLCPWIIEYFLI